MSDVVDALRQIADAKPGGPMPACLQSSSVWSGKTIETQEVTIGLMANNWGGPLSAICAEAIAEIERLRTVLARLRSIAGVASIDGGLTLNQIKQQSRTQAFTDSETLGKFSGETNEQ